jgi:predicted dehydrogenase
MSPLNRRQFAGSAAAVAAGAWSGVVRAATNGSPNEKLRIACIGTQNQAGFSIGNCRSQEIVALCDADSDYLDRRGAEFPKAARYRDFRKLLEAEAPRIDAVVVATPDHIHAPAAAMALRLGKHVYCEKPLTHTVAEARLLATLAKEKNLATQMGTQVHATENYRRVVELVKGGAIGPVKETHVWCGKGWSDGRFDSGHATPKGLDWDLWLGPAKERPFSSNIHPANWRRFWEYGTGTLGDMGCHVLDLAFWALDLKHPTSVAAEGPALHADGAPAWVAVTWEFPARGELPPVSLTWHDGAKRPPLLAKLKADGGPDLAKWGLGVAFVGERGVLVADYGRRLLLPEEKFKDFKPPAKSIAASVGHHEEWFRACKSGSPTTCNFGYSGALSETVLLGTVAYRAGKKLDWDGAALKATNCPAADAIINKEYRRGWSPFV